MLLSLRSKTLKFTGVEISNPHGVDIPRGLSVVIGPNGAGKSSLGRIIDGGWNFMTNDITTPLERKLRIKTIEFSDIHALAGFHTEYYQQRFDSMMNDEVATVGELLGERIDSDIWRDMAPRLRLLDITDKRINYLSSGELRKFLIANMLFDLPDLLILDNPYIGLDAPSRDILNDTLAAITDKGVSVMLLLCNPIEIPPAAKAAVAIRDMELSAAISREPGESIEDFRSRFAPLFDYSIDLADIPWDATGSATDGGDSIFALRDCKVRYGSRTILNHVSWEVKRGERWSLSGPNGCGKSTLLSLVNADNPQAYANDVTVFGHRRGSGESIWDIKSRIGYVSPEMHLYFKGRNNTLLDVVEAGLRDTLGFFSRPTPQERDKAERWLRLLHLEDLAMRRFSTLSYGQQRLALLARTMIKCPELLILDEPLHGLDTARKAAIRSLIDAIAERTDVTLVYVTHYLPETPACVAHHKPLQAVSAASEIAE